jgi:hypothetical protein
MTQIWGWESSTVVPTAYKLPVAGIRAGDGTPCVIRCAGALATPATSGELFKGRGDVQICRRE